ncbi:hypothetical protein [Streptomyces mexicanus]|jgi:hypothetical protein|uniref:hypothetical protein n=1 Tax=Streptomyces mexicanus TaxID=178566 RepID=UPI0036AAC02A
MGYAPIFAVGLSGKPPEHSAAILKLASNDVPLIVQPLASILDGHLRKARESPLPHASRLVKGEWPLRISTGHPCGDRALGELLFRRIADTLPTLAGSITAVYLGKRHIHQALDDLLDWMCAKLLDGRPTALAVLTTPLGVRWHRLTPAGPDASQPAPKSLPCTPAETELLLTLARLAAYERHRDRLHARSGPPGTPCFLI